MTSGKTECPRCGRLRYVNALTVGGTCADCRGLTIPETDAADLAWKNDGVCAQTDPEAFFDDVSRGTAAAKRVCRRCPVTSECLAYALRNRELTGVWGGLFAFERRKLVHA